MCQQFAISHVLWHKKVHLHILNVPEKHIEYCQKINKDSANTNKQCAPKFTQFSLIDQCLDYHHAHGAHSHPLYIYSYI